MLFVLVGQTYMFSLLQSLHLIPTNAFPTLRMLVPFRQHSFIQFPHFPRNLTVRTIGLFAFAALTSPFTLVYVYVHCRPVLESRLYRVLRRKFPKPDRPDNLSLRIAVENDLVEWTVPNLGGRSDEEARRRNLTIGEELICELKSVTNWFKGLFGSGERRSTQQNSEDMTETERYETLRNRIEQFRSMLPPEGQNARLRGARRSPELPHEAESSRRNEPNDQRQDLSFEGNQILPDHDRAMVQSPIQYISEPLDGMRSTGRSGIDELSTRGRATSVEQRETQNGDQEDPLQPRSDALSSRRSSPDSTPLTPPRIRASLIHQNSDIITMQLELLRDQNNISRDHIRDNSNTNGINIPSEISEPANVDFEALDRAAGEILDTLLAHSNRPDNHDERGLDDDVSPAEQGVTGTDNADATNTNFQPTTNFDGVPNTSSSNIRESEQIDRNEHFRERQSSDAEWTRNVPPPISRPRDRTRSELTPSDHRVSILSLHPADGLASHVATLATSMLLYPLESMYLRSLATNFLSYQTPVDIPPAGAMAAVVGLRGDVREIGNWFGGGGTVDMLNYAGRMLTVLSIETALSSGVWAVGTAAAVLLGKRRFGWGNL